MSSLIDIQNNEFAARHIGVSAQETAEMLQVVGYNSIDELVDATVPQKIRLTEPLQIPPAISEYELLQELKTIAAKNKVYKSYIGTGYYNCITPSVIQRNIFENPGWYTQYTPYQAEIAQGRLESLLNFQTMVVDLTGLPLANASLLDEATAAAEAMLMFYHSSNKRIDEVVKNKFFVDNSVFPQTKDVLITRATPVGIELVFGNYKEAAITDAFFGALLQYPAENGAINDYRGFIANMHNVGAYVVVATDLLALTLLTPPGELGADCAVGNSQRFGIPLGFGGPHAAFFSTTENFKRDIPGRIIGISQDAQGNVAYRMALQTREQHIKREKATSNICTAQALLANMSAMYAVYHGATGLKNIATRVSGFTQILATKLREKGFQVNNQNFFDTIEFAVPEATLVQQKALAQGINFGYKPNNVIHISLDETVTQKDLQAILSIFDIVIDEQELDISTDVELQNIPAAFKRGSAFLTSEVFQNHHSETKMMRYIKILENKDLSLNRSMISLGSCTMKLNAATELIPVSWPEFAAIHPFAPQDQWLGYQELIMNLQNWLSSITGFAATSLQPNSGANGEYAGLLTIKAYFDDHGQSHRNIMLIPVSAHGTNPASAVMAGYKVVVVQCDEHGNIDVIDLKQKAQQHAQNLGGLMVTYPSTHGVFEEDIMEICNIIHQNGGLVYMDGANMNAQVGLTSPGKIGADVCQLNLHKTFAIPHGGGGPGVGPICTTKQLAPYLPGHVGVTFDQPTKATHAVSAAPFGSAGILAVSYAYIRMLGATGLTQATKYALLNANYMRAKLQSEFKILYSGRNGTCAHEFIVDLRPFKQSASIEAEDVAKRLMDYNFHAPTLSFPVAGTIMIEPTESEAKIELDRFCNALLSIRKEIADIENGNADKQNNLLKNAPHTQQVVIEKEWIQPYSREAAVFPLHYVRESKFWPTISRINNTLGDRNLICTCLPTDAYAETD